MTGMLTVAPHGQLVEKIRLEDYYADLKPGKYRLTAWRLPSLETRAGCEILFRARRPLKFNLSLESNEITLEIKDALKRTRSSVNMALVGFASALLGWNWFRSRRSTEISATVVA